MSDLKTPLAQVAAQAAAAGADGVIAQSRTRAEAGQADTDDYRGRMVTARWRDMYFLTDSHELKGGRRLVVHQFPGGDVPLVQDQGATAPGWRLNAYFIGAHYDRARDVFLGLLNIPGATWLQHPWLGQLWARAHTWSVAESNEKGGSCTISIEFVPGGLAATEPVLDRVDQARFARTTLVEVAKDDFELPPLSAGAFEVFQAAVQKDLEQLRSVISRVTMPLTYANACIAMVQQLQGNLETLLAVPGQYAAALDSAVNALAGLGNLDFSQLNVSERRVGSGGATVRSVTQVASLALLAQEVAANPSSVVISSTVATVALRRALASEASLRAQLLVVAAAELAITDYRAAEDRDAAQIAVVGAIDALLPILPDAAFQAALDTRATLIAVLQAQDLTPAQTRALVAPMPSVVLAHRMGVDEAVLLERNAVRHPLFVQGVVRG